MTGMEKFVRNEVIFSLALNILLNFLMIKSYGIIGAAIATSISIITSIIIKMTYFKIKFNFLPLYIPFFLKNKRLGK